MRSVLLNTYPGFVLLVGTMFLFAGSARGQDQPATRVDNSVRSLLINPNGPYRAIVDKDWNGLPSWNGDVAFPVDLQDALAGRLIDEGDETFGATFQPLTPVQRAQLNIPAGHGLLVASVRADGPSAQAGLKKNDILLSLADKPLASAEDLTRQLKTVGERPVPLKLLRDGRPITIAVRPIYHVTLGPAQQHKTEYYIGVAISPVDPVLREQLGVKGVVVTDVIKGSPAEKAGIKKYDIIETLLSKPVDSPQTLARLVQANEGKPLAVRLLRAGHIRQVQLTPAARQVTIDTDSRTLRVYLSDVRVPLALTQTQAAYPVRDLLIGVPTQRAGNEVMQLQLDRRDKEVKALQRMEAIEKELKDLHQELKKLRMSLKSGVTER